MHTIWTVLGFALIAVLLPVFYAGSLVLGLRRSDQLQQTLKRFPELRKFERCKIACGQLIIAGALPAMWHSIGGGCSRRIWLLGALLQLLACAVYIGVNGVEKQERERLEQRTPEPAGNN